MSATLVVNGFPKGHDETIRRAIRYGVCNLSGTYPGAPGIPLNWNAMTNPSGATEVVPSGPQNTQPQWVEFVSNSDTGYDYVYDTAADTLRIFSAGVELAAAAAITADVISFKAEWPKGTL